MIRPLISGARYEEIRKAHLVVVTQERAEATALDVVRDAQQVPAEIKCGHAGVGAKFSFTNGMHARLGDGSLMPNAFTKITAKIDITKSKTAHPANPKTNKRTHVAIYG